MLGDLLEIGSWFANRKRQKSQFNTTFNESKRQFDQQMNESITRRVADAKNAGVHPLYALGASVGASPTTVYGGGSSQTPQLSGMNELMKILLGADVDEKRAATKSNEADANLKNAQAAKLRSDTNARGRDMDPYGDATFYSPEVPKSQRPGVAAGTHPARIEVKDEMGNVFTLPNPDIGLDEVGQLEYVLGMPSRIYGEIKRDYQTRKEIQQMEKEVARLRYMRENPEKVQEFNRLASRWSQTTAKVIRRIKSMRFWK